MSDLDLDFLDQKYLVDPYGNWAKAEGVPIVTGAAIDLMNVTVEPWARFGVKGAICHVDGRCDYLNAFVFEIAAGASSAPMRHVYEECYYVLDGTGTTEITLSDGSRHNIEWGPKRLFAAPVNAHCIHRASGTRPARLVALNDLRYLMGLYRNETFLFDNPTPFHARQAKAVAAGLAVDPLGQAEGATPLADMSLGIDLTIIAGQGSGTARRQMQGQHLLGVDGGGLTLSFKSPDADPIRTPWRHGVLVGLPGMFFHQHSSTGAAPACMLTIELGSISSPMFRSRRAAYGDTLVYASGAATIQGR
jgi:mannose-6-phosphate isomerase-like protein (cupin superfamily)